MTGTAISLGMDGVSKPPPEPLLSHSRMSPLRRNSLLNQGNLLHQPPHLHQGAHLDEEAHLYEDAQGTVVKNSLGQSSECSCSRLLLCIYNLL